MTEFRGFPDSEAANFKTPKSGVSEKPKLEVLSKSPESAEALQKVSLWDKEMSEDETKRLKSDLDTLLGMSDETAQKNREKFSQAMSLAFSKMMEAKGNAGASAETKQAYETVFTKGSERLFGEVETDNLFTADAVQDILDDFKQGAWSSDDFDKSRLGLADKSKGFAGKLAEGARNNSEVVVKALDYILEDVGKDLHDRAIEKPKDLQEQKKQLLVLEAAYKTLLLKKKTESNLKAASKK